VDDDFAPDSSGQASLIADSALAEKLGLWLRMAHRAFAETVNNDLRHLKITQFDFFILTLVGERPGCRQATIARKLSIKSPNLAAAVDYLVERGFVSKTADPTDRRANHLRLTPTGESLVEDIDRRYASITAGFLGSDREQQLRLAISLLRRIALRPVLSISARPTLESHDPNS